MHIAPRTWVEIDEAAIAHNLDAIGRIAGHQLIAPVIKSNAYGHGDTIVARICDAHKCVPLMCVSFLSEALHLKAAGIEKPLLVFSGIDADPAQSIGKDIQFTVSDSKSAILLNNVARTHNHSIAVHLKIDTGLSRFGTDPETALPLAREIASLSHLHLVGTYTHFAAAAQEENISTHTQIKTFTRTIETLKNHGITLPYIHCANSASVGFALPHCTLVRPGIMVYGIWPAAHIKEQLIVQHPELTLRPVLSWKTSIIQERIIPAGRSVGYEHTYYTTRDTRIGILPVGYYDGYHPQLGNRTHVLVEGQFARVIGRVAMNVISIDITDIPTAHAGSEVTLLGKEDPISATTLAQLAGNCNVRQLLACLNANIPRIPTSARQSKQPINLQDLSRQKHREVRR